MSGCCGQGPVIVSGAAATPRVDVETLLLCDVLPDGTVAGLALVEPVYDTVSGDRVGTRIVDPTTGTAYTPAGTLGLCSPPDSCARQISTVHRCDDTDADGEPDTRFTEVWALDPCNGEAPELLGTFAEDDYGTPYTPVAPVDCPEPSTDSPVVLGQICYDAGGETRTAAVLKCQACGDATVTYLDVETGDPVTAPVVVPCAAEESRALLLCDVLPDGTSTSFLRTYTIAPDGATTYADTALDGTTPYTVTGTAGACLPVSDCASPTTPTATVGLCLADGTPIAVTVVRDCEGVITSSGWINLLTGAYSAGAPPAGAMACGDSQSIQLSGTFCDVDGAGDVVGLVLIEYSYDAEGAIDSVRLVDAVTGTTYVPAGTVTVCPAGVEQPERDLVQLCDVAGDGTSTPFIRDFGRDENGAITGHSDYALDGTPYTASGTVGACTTCRPTPLGEVCYAPSVAPQFLNVGTVFDGSWEQTHLDGNAPVANPATLTGWATAPTPSTGYYFLAPGPITGATRYALRTSLSDTGPGWGYLRTTVVLPSASTDFAVSVIGDDRPHRVWVDGVVVADYSAVPGSPNINDPAAHLSTWSPVTTLALPLAAGPHTVIMEYDNNAPAGEYGALDGRFVLASTAPSARARAFQGCDGERILIDIETGLTVPDTAVIVTCPDTEGPAPEALMLCDITQVPGLDGERAALNLTTLPNGPTAGTFGNGINWSVDQGTAGGAGTYLITTGTTQTWTFDQPAMLRFGVNNLNVGNECVTLPPGTVVESIHPNHSWNPTTRVLCNGGSALDSDESIFTLDAATTLAITSNPGGGGARGLVRLEAGLTAFAEVRTPFLRTICRTCGEDPAITDTELDAVTPYVPAGIVGVCATSTQDQEHDLVQLCDTAPDGTVTAFIRDYARDATGTVTGHSDYAVDGAPYTPTGTVGRCCATTVLTECAYSLPDTNTGFEVDGAAFPGCWVGVAGAPSYAFGDRVTSWEGTYQSDTGSASVALFSSPDLGGAIDFTAFTPALPVNPAQSAAGYVGTAVLDGITVTLTALAGNGLGVWQANPIGLYLNDGDAFRIEFSEPVRLTLGTSGFADPPSLNERFCAVAFETVPWSALRLADCEGVVTTVDADTREPLPDSAVLDCTPSASCGDTEIAQLCDLVSAAAEPIEVPADSFALTGNVQVIGLTLQFSRSNVPVTGVANRVVSGLISGAACELLFDAGWGGGGAPPATNNAIYRADILDGVTVLATSTVNLSNGSASAGAVVAQPPLAFTAPPSGTVTVRFTDLSTGGAINRDLVIRPLTVETEGAEVTAIPFLRAYVYDCTGALQSTTDTTLDGSTAYTPQGDVGLCTVTATAADSCTSQILERCGCDDTNGDGIADASYTELWAVDPCSGEDPVLLGTFLDGDLSQPYTPVAPVDCIASEVLSGEPVLLCDSGVPFLRHIRYAGDGSPVSVVDTELDGTTPYTVTGTVGGCAAASTPDAVVSTGLRRLAASASLDVKATWPGLQSASVTVLSGTAQVTPTGGPAVAVPAGVTLTWSVADTDDSSLDALAVAAAVASDVLINATYKASAAG
ncbi:hypothetical protein [Streptomyces cadmiisoli]|uniref:hypothetical protein n=1 Tax=Streptomyces cadmiisoli TaxID=2184053 RepID=UPI0036502DF8